MPAINTDDFDDADDEDWYEDDSDDGEPIDCPECGAELWEFVDKCAKCGYWLSEADRRKLRRGEERPAWQRATAAILIAGFILCLILAGLTIF
jgi:hypothetical protein